MNTTFTYVLAGLQIFFGAVGFLAGWIESDLAMTLVMTGLSTFGITRQNVQLGKALGKAV